MYGDVTLRGIEIGPRRETRKHVMAQMSVGDFVKAKSAESATRAHYVVDPVPAPMLDDLHVPSVVQCGGATDTDMKLHLWMSSGGTESVLHNDQCVALLVLSSPPTHAHAHTAVLSFSFIAR